jgi:hypothetical protein
LEKEISKLSLTDPVVYDFFQPHPRAIQHKSKKNNKKGQQQQDPEEQTKRVRRGISETERTRESEPTRIRRRSELRE